MIPPTPVQRDSSVVQNLSFGLDGFDGFGLKSWDMPKLWPISCAIIFLIKFNELNKKLRNNKNKKVIKCFTSAEVKSFVKHSLIPALYPLNESG